MNARQLLGEALVSHALLADSGEEVLNAWCEDRSKKLADPAMGEQVKLLVERVRGAHWIAGIADNRPNGMLDDSALAAIIMVLDSGTPLCTEDDDNAPVEDE